MKKTKITPEMAVTIKELWEKGVVSKDIQELYGLKPATISQHIRRHGISRPFGISSRTNLKANGDGRWICFKCNIPKSAAEYQINRCGNLIGYCRDCRSKGELSRIHSSDDLWLGRKLTQYKHRANEEEQPFDIDADYVKWLYKEQKGLCFYSDIELPWGHNPRAKHFAFSIDRVVSNGGYVKGNCVLAQTRINGAKGDFTLDEMKLWMTEWHRRIMSCEWL
jgi:hypothetical protein